MIFPLTSSPASVPAVVAIVLAAAGLIVNHRRPINQCWALTLLFIALWQGFIALAQYNHGPLLKLMFVRLGSFWGAYVIWCSWLLAETIAVPWRSMRSNILQVRHQLLLIVLYFFVFTIWYIPSTSTPEHRQYGPVYWLLNLCASISELTLISYCIWRIRGGKVTGISKAELSAFIVLSSFTIVSYFSTFLFISIFKFPPNPWLSSVILVVGLVLLTVLLVRSEIFDLHDIKRMLVLIFARSCLYVLIGIICLVAINTVGTSTHWQILGSVLTVSLLLLLVSPLDRQLRAFIDRCLMSQNFVATQVTVNALIESTIDGGELHTKYLDLLLRWSDGSSEVFLSDAVFATSWPPKPIPPALLSGVAEQGWITPEILDRQGTKHLDALAFLVENQVGAVICYTAQSGEKLLAAFKMRATQRPFVSRELREAHELLRVMRLGFSFVKLRQKLRGNDRLNFYSQYAPQFAHELRNGLYLQTQLLRAIADGRREDVNQTDAKRGLEQVAQVDRLCDHFFNVGALFNRPIGALNVHETLSAIVDTAAAQYVKGTNIEIKTSFDVQPGLKFLANEDLLEVALFNLIKNGIDALAGTDRPARIEVNVSKHLEKIHLFLKDNGPGLPNERCQDPFAPGLSRKRKGMGLGLAIVRDCVEAMGGTVGVRSTSDEGTCFEISLACAERADGTAVAGDFIGATT